MSTPALPPIIILMVEDNPADVVLFQEAAGASQTATDVHVAVNGVEALRYLRQEVPSGQAPRPDIVVLDLNLPLMNGQEFLAEIASDPAIPTIPVAILTTSASETHARDLYPQGRCLYFSKTADFNRLQDIVRKIATHARAAGSGA